MWCSRQYQPSQVARLAVAFVTAAVLAWPALPQRAVIRATATALRQTQETQQQSSVVKPIAPEAGCVPAPSGLVGWWPFDGNSLDFYLNHNAGLGGNPAFVPREVAQALNIDGVDDSTLVIGGPASSLNVGAGDEFTIDLWINPSDLSVQRPLVEWNNGAGLFNSAEGIFVGSSGNQIGGTTAAARNVISGNFMQGIGITSTQNLVQGNFIGTNAAGNAALGNGQEGLLVTGSASNNTVGLVPRRGCATPLTTAHCPLKINTQTCYAARLRQRVCLAAFTGDAS